MDDLESTIEKLSTEIEELTKERDAIMNKISALSYKRDILLKAKEVLTEAEVNAPYLGKPPRLFKLKMASPIPKDGKGMTASALKLLSTDKFMSVLEILRSLENEGYKTKRVNVYIMLKRLVDAGKVICKEEDNLKKYALAFIAKKGLIF